MKLYNLLNIPKVVPQNQTITTVILLMLAASIQGPGFAQEFIEGRVILSNFEPGACSQVFDVDQVTLLAGERYQAQLWYRLAGSSDDFVPLESSVGFRADNLAGFFLGGEVDVPVPVGTVIEAQVRVWDTQSGDSWEDATVRFQSNIIVVSPLCCGPPSPNLIGLEFTSLQIHRAGDGFTFTWPNQQRCESIYERGYFYQLESAEDIHGPWIPVEEPAELVDGRWQVTLDNPNSFQGYFRLRRVGSDPQMLLALMEQLGIAPELIDEAMVVMADPQ